MLDAGEGVVVGGMEGEEGGGRLGGGRGAVGDLGHGRLHGAVAAAGGEAARAVVPQELQVGGLGSGGRRGRGWEA